MTLGEKLYNLRKDKKLTQLDAAKLAECSLRSWLSYEHDERKPRTLEKYEKMAEVLDCTVAYLMTEAELDRVVTKESAFLMASQLSIAIADPDLLTAKEKISLTETVMEGLYSCVK